MLQQRIKRIFTFKQGNLALVLHINEKGDTKEEYR